MEVTLTWNSLILLSGVLAAISAVAGYMAKAVRFVDRQKAQDAELAALKKQHEKDKKELYTKTEEELTAIYQEQTLLTYGVLACLKGLQEKGCNGPVTAAVDKIEKHINEKAHARKGGFYHE